MWLALALFTATICLAVSLLWLVEGDAEPGVGMVVLAVAAVASMIVSSFADRTWSARRLGAIELGNATRLFAVTSILFLAPTALISLTGDDVPELEARDLDAACPPDEVPEAAFPDLSAGSALERTASCLAWWDVVAADGNALAGAEVVPRAQAAAFLDRLVSSVGEPLAPAPPGAVPADAASSVHAQAIARLVASGIMGGVDDERFAPGEPVTRGQLSTLVARAHEHVTGEALPAVSEALFTDVEGGVHADAIRAVAVAGIAVGNDGEFSPSAPVTRAQLLTIFARTLDLWVANGGASLPTQP